MKSARRAVLILVDGLRPDALPRAHTPNLHRLIASGSATMSARSVMPSITLPCLTSIFYGVGPERHGVMTNTWRPFDEPVPSLFDILHSAGHRTLMYYNWGELRDMSRPGSVDESHLIDYRTMEGDGTERLLFEMARTRLSSGDFGFAFLYYGALDVTGHADGWMSDPYLRRVADADSAVGRLLPTLPADCLVVVTSDHGGHDKTHGLDCDEDMTVPLVVVGRSIPRGVTVEAPVSLVDVAPTILSWFEIDAPGEWTGTAIQRAGSQRVG